MRGSHCGIVAYVLNIVVSEFELQSCYYVHFHTLVKSMNPFIPLAMVLIVPLQFFDKDGFDIK